MNQTNANIQFNYLYRDASNYKNYGAVIFTNPNNLSVADIEGQIKQYLIDGEFFDITGLGIPHLYFDNLIEDDHTWREFVSVEVIGEDPTDGRGIEEFLNILCASLQSIRLN